MKTLQTYIDKLNALNFKDMYNGDFFLTWEKTDDEIEAVFTIADALRYMRENNISTKVFESGLGISLFRDNSTRTRFSFASACNLLGLEVQDLDEGKSQVAHGETVRETANMISFMADVIGIRDDMYIGKGNAYMHEVVDAVKQGLFHIYTISTIEQGIEILTGVPAGRKDETSRFPAGSVNCLAYAKLRKYAKISSKAEY